MTRSKCETNAAGTKRWFNEKGEFHRLEGPAVEYTNGDREWFVEGSRHRLDGSAIEFADGTKAWFIKGEYLPQQQFERHPLVIFYRLSLEHV